MRSQQLENAQKLLYEEQRKIEDMQLHYEAEIRKCTRELNVFKEEQNDKASSLDQAQKSMERHSKELELKESQLESLRA